MPAFFTRCFEAIVKALPAALVRVLLLVTLIGAAVLHFYATGRIGALERSQDALVIQNGHVLRAVNDLAAEVRGYRDDIREENKALKKQRLTGPKE